jgi:hypothetical protein
MAFLLNAVRRREVRGVNGGLQPWSSFNRPLS